MATAVMGVTVATTISNRTIDINAVEEIRMLNWKLEVEARPFLDVDANDPLLGGFKQDSFVTLRITRYL